MERSEHQGKPWNPDLYPSDMTNVEEAQFKAAPYPKSLQVTLNRPEGYTHDQERLWMEAREEVEEQLEEGEFVQSQVGIFGESVGERMRWTALFQIDLKEADQG